MFGIPGLTRVHACFFASLEQLTASRIKLLALLFKLAHALDRAVETTASLADLCMVVIQLADQLSQFGVDAQQSFLGAVKSPAMTLQLAGNLGQPTMAGMGFALGIVAIALGIDARDARVIEFTRMLVDFGAELLDPV